MRIKDVLILLGGIYLFAFGFRFILGYFLGHSMPAIPTLDLFIDWIPALVLGFCLIVLIIGKRWSLRRPGVIRPSTPKGVKEQPPRSGHPGLNANLIREENRAVDEVA